MLPLLNTLKRFFDCDPRDEDLSECDFASGSLKCSSLEKRLLKDALKEDAFEECDVVDLFESILSFIPLLSSSSHLMLFRDFDPMFFKFSSCSKRVSQRR